jgi:hypothetical protein
VINRDVRQIPANRIRFTKAPDIIKPSISRQELQAGIPRQANYRMTRGQSVAIAEVNRKDIFAGGPLPEPKIPTYLRNTFRPNATSSGLGAFPIALVTGAAGLIGKPSPFAKKLTPAQVQQQQVSFLTGSLVSKLQTKLGRAPLTPDQALQIIQSGGAVNAASFTNPQGPSIFPLQTTVTVPTVNNLSPSVSPAWSYGPAEVSPLSVAPGPGAAASYPAVDSTSSTPSTGAPSWLLPVAIAAGLFLLLRGK